MDAAILRPAAPVGLRTGPTGRCCDGNIMMARTQITMQPEIQRRARQRASDLGVSLAEYVRRLVARDPGNSSAKSDPAPRSAGF